ncbi:hypothetical protein CBM2600_A10021 [Cupriavidus taiwanensis]|nr:hypothetical protein CBM2600_A10021 [Cupriavidus taiwanensis]
MIPCRTRRTGNRLLPGSFRKAAPVRGWRQIALAGRGSAVGGIAAQTANARQIPYLTEPGCRDRCSTVYPHARRLQKAADSPEIRSEGLGTLELLNGQEALYGLQRIQLHYGACPEASFRRPCPALFGACMDPRSHRTEIRRHPRIPR